jgi:hypothetical protein
VDGRGPDDVPRAPLPGWLPQLDHGDQPPPAAPLARSAEDQAEFARLWAAVGVRLEPGDRTYRCPFHDDRHPSLHVDAEGCRWYCFGCAVGGGLGRLRRQVGRVEHRPRPTPDLGGVTLTADEMASVDVVGEADHQQDLERLAGGRRRRSARLDTVAHLKPEPGIPGGEITVEIRGLAVGHLERADTDRYRPMVTDAARRYRRATCAAQIRGGWARPGDIGRFGVVLWLPALD